MTYQKCQYIDRLYDIPISTIDSEEFVLLEKIQNSINSGIKYFTHNGLLIPFECDGQGNKLKPYRIRTFISDVIYCYKRLPSETHNNAMIQMVRDIHRDVPMIRENTEILKSKVDAILRQTFELAEFTIPRLFIVLPEETATYNPENWFHYRYRLYFLCECEDDHERHLAFHDGYEIKQPREFLIKYGHHTRRMLTLVKYATTIGSIVIPSIGSFKPNNSIPNVFKDRFMWGNFKQQLEQMNETLEIAERTVDFSTDQAVQHLQGAELRKIKHFLRRVDNQQTLGGEIRRESAVIDGQDSKKLSQLLDLLRQGLSIISITFKNIKFEEKDFNNLLTFISQNTLIRYAEFDNIRVAYNLKPDKKYREIISELNTALQENTKLNIQYNVEMPLNKFSSKLSDTIKKSSPRLSFRIGSIESIPSLEITGTNQSDFSLTAIHAETKNDRLNYIQAFQNVCSRNYNITKLHFQGKSFTRETWSYFSEFVKSSQMIRELTFYCQLTLEQTQELCTILKNNQNLMILQLINIWESTDEIEGLQEFFLMLCKNSTLREFVAISESRTLPLDFIADCLTENQTLEVLKLPKCSIDINTNIKLIENFLEKTSIHTLSLELIETNSQRMLEKIATIINNNLKINLLELRSSSCLAIFCRRNQSFHIQDTASQSSGQKSKNFSRQMTFKKLFNLFSCIGTQSRQSYDSNSSSPLVHNSIIAKSNESCSFLHEYLPIYKQIHERADNLKLEELDIITSANIDIEQLKSHSTLIRLRIAHQTFTEENIRILENVIRMNQNLKELEIVKSEIICPSDVKRFIQLIQTLAKSETLSHLNLTGTSILLNQLIEIFQILRSNRTLKVLNIQECIIDSTNQLFKQHIKQLSIENPFIEIFY
ncbi:unnamed protein product [Rotaria sp. Silwood2]|nr:unnamed protein product [Rotaria sp. Silwood2]CAF4447120.1 unnamed protein product [Rotaria sp. Silwood2]